VNLTTDKFHCWSCGWGSKSSIEPILRLKKDSEFYIEYVGSPNQQKPEEKVRVYQTVVLPKEFRPLSEAHRSPYCQQAMAYLASRGVTFEHILLYRLGYCEDGDFKNYVIFPSFDSLGELNFFIGRSWLQSEASSAGLRYKIKEISKDVIFNDYLVDWTKPVRLVEGVFDAIKGGTNAIPILGTGLRRDSKLMHKILESRVPVYVALDADAYGITMRVINMLLSFGVRVMYVDLNGKKDPGEMTPGEFEDRIIRSVTIDTALDMVKLKVLRSGSRF